MCLFSVDDGIAVRFILFRYFHYVSIVCPVVARLVMSRITLDGWVAQTAFRFHWGPGSCFNRKPLTAGKSHQPARLWRSFWFFWLQQGVCLRLVEISWDWLRAWHKRFRSAWAHKGAVSGGTFRPGSGRLNEHGAFLSLQKQLNIDTSENGVWYGIIWYIYITYIYYTQINI